MYLLVSYEVYICEAGTTPAGTRLRLRLEQLEHSPPKEEAPDETLMYWVPARQPPAATLGFARVPVNAIDNTADQQDCEYAPPCRFGCLWKSLWVSLVWSIAKQRSNLDNFRLDGLGDIWMYLL